MVAFLLNWFNVLEFLQFIVLRLDYAPAFVSTPSHRGILNYTPEGSAYSSERGQSLRLGENHSDFAAILMANRPE
jgi:hypothetical protein